MSLSFLFCFFVKDVSVDTIGDNNMCLRGEIPKWLKWSYSVHNSAKLCVSTHCTLYIPKTQWLQFRRGGTIAHRLRFRRSVDGALWVFLWFNINDKCILNSYDCLLILGKNIFLKKFKLRIFKKSLYAHRRNCRNSENWVIFIMTSQAGHDTAQKCYQP